MKKIIYLIMAFVAVIIISCNNSKKETKGYPLQGAWELTYTKYVYPDTTYETTQFANPDVKLLTKRHFAFGLQSGADKIVGGGGEYTYDGNIYTEFVKYHTWFSFFVGKSIEFKSTLKGDLWTISGIFKNDTLQINATETWKRIPE